MPKLAKTYEDEFRAVYEGRCAYMGYKTRAKQEKLLGITEDTLLDHLRNPEKFRQWELRRIYTALKFTAEERDLLNHSGRMRLT